MTDSKAVPLKERIAAAFLMGAGWKRLRGDLSIRARAEEPFVVVLANEVGRFIRLWRRDALDALKEGLNVVLFVLLMLLITVLLPVSLPLIALVRRRRARKEVADYEARRQRTRDIPGAA